MNDPVATEAMHQAIQAERRGAPRRAIELLRPVAAGGTGPLVLDARLRLGRLLFLVGDRDEAETVLQSARAEAEQAAAPRQAATAIHLLALLARQRGQRQAAWQLLEASPVLRQPTSSGPETAQWFHYRGLLAADVPDWANAERLFFRAHQIYHELGHDPGLAEVYDSLANLLLNQGKGRAALTFARSSLEVKQRLGDRYGEALTFGTLGRIHLLRACHDEARAAFSQDLAIARELGDLRGVGIMLNSLAEVAVLQNELTAATDCYRESLAQNCGIVNDIHAHLGLARVHVKAAQPADAASACDEAERLLKAQAPDSPLHVLLTGLRGTVAWHQGDYDTGKRRLSEAIEALNQRGAALDSIPFLYDLRDLHQQRGDRVQAIKQMCQALDILCECGAERSIADAEDWLRTVDSPGLTRLALDRFLPNHVIDSVLAGRLSRPHSQRQNVAVLFCDVRNYTSISERLAPEEVVDILNEWFGEVTRIIRRHRGVVDKFVGDAVMALFGVPDPQPEAAANAVRAALAMRDMLVALNLRRTVLGGQELRIGIGIDTGPVVVGCIGSHLRQSYTAIGDPVNTASRLESATKDHPGCDILISQATEDGQQRQNVAETEFLGYEQLKGRSQPVAIYRVRGLRSPTNPASSVDKCPG